MIAAPDPDADELNALKANHPLLPVAVDAGSGGARTTYNPAMAKRFIARWYGKERPIRPC